MEELTQEKLKNELIKIYGKEVYEWEYNPNPNVEVKNCLYDIGKKFRLDKMKIIEIFNQFSLNVGWEQSDKTIKLWEDGVIGSFWLYVKDINNKFLYFVGVGMYRHVVYRSEKINLKELENLSEAKDNGNNNTINLGKKSCLLRLFSLKKKHSFVLNIYVDNEDKSILNVTYTDHPSFANMLIRKLRNNVELKNDHNLACAKLKELGDKDNLSSVDTRNTDKNNRTPNQVEYDRYRNGNEIEYLSFVNYSLLETMENIKPVNDNIVDKGKSKSCDKFLCNKWNKCFDCNNEEKAVYPTKFNISLKENKKEMGLTISEFEKKEDQQKKERDTKLLAQIESNLKNNNSKKENVAKDYRSEYIDSLTDNERNKYTKDNELAYINQENKKKDEAYRTLLGYDDTYNNVAVELCEQSRDVKGFCLECGKHKLWCDGHILDSNSKQLYHNNAIVDNNISINEEKNEFFICPTHKMPLDECICEANNLCPWDYCDKFHDETVACSDQFVYIDNSVKEIIADINHDSGWDSVSQRSDNKFQNDEIFTHSCDPGELIDIDYGSIDLTIHSKMFYKLDNNKVVPPPFYDQNWYEKFSKKADNKRVTNNNNNRGTRGARRPQDEYYRLESIKKGTYGVSMSKVSKNNNYSLADYAMHLLLNDVDNKIFDNIVRSKRMTKTEINKMIDIIDSMMYLFNDESNAFGGSYNNNIVNMMEKLIDWLRKVYCYKEESGLFVINKVVDVYSNSDAEENLARAWARLMHSYNGNIDSENVKSDDQIVNEQNKQEDNIDIEVNKFDALNVEIEKNNKQGICFKRIHSLLGKLNEKTADSKLWCSNDKNDAGKYHVSPLKFADSYDITYQRLFELVADEGYEFDDDEKEEIASNVEKKETLSSVVTLSLDAEVRNSIPVEESLRYYIQNILRVDSDKVRRIDNWIGCLAKLNEIQIMHVVRQEFHSMVPNDSNVTTMIPITHPRLDAWDNQNQCTRWDEVELFSTIFRVRMNQAMNGGNSLSIVPLFEKLYLAVSSGGDMSFFRPFFGTKWQDVLSKQLLQRWVLTTKNLTLNKGSDIRRWLTLLCRMQQQGDVVDYNLFANTADLRVLGVNQRPVKIRTERWADPNNLAQPELFPLLPNNHVSFDLNGDRYLPTYRCSMDDWVRYVILGSEIPAGTVVGGAYTIEDIVNGQIAVVFVHPYMNDNRRSMTEHTIGHLSHPLFHWNYRLGVELVDGIEANGTGAIADYRQESWNANNLDNDGNLLKYQNFYATSVSNDVLIDGPSKGVLYVTTNDVSHIIHLTANTNITHASNYFRPIANADLPIDLRPILMNYEQLNQEGSAFENVMSWINKETGNKNDFIAANAIYTNLCHVHGLPVVESQIGYGLKFYSIGNNARMATGLPNGTLPAPNGLASEAYFGHVFDNVGNMMDNTNMAATVQSYMYLTSCMGQRKHYLHNKNYSDQGYEISINDMDIYEKTAIMIGTHCVSEKTDLSSFINFGMYDFIARGKEAAKAMTKMSEMVFQQTEKGMAILLQPRSIAIPYYSSKLFQDYYNGDHVHSNQMVKLYDCLTNNIYKDEAWYNKFVYYGQYGMVPAIGISVIIGTFLSDMKWMREYGTFGFGENDKIKWTTKPEIDWHDEEYTFTRDTNNHALRFLKKYKQQWTEINQLSWTRLALINITANFRMGYEQTSYYYKNFVDKEKNTWYSKYQTLSESGLTMYEPAKVYSETTPRAFVTYQLLYNEILCKDWLFGTVDSVLPWSIVARGWIQVAVSSQLNNKFDPYAPYIFDNGCHKKFGQSFLSKN